MKRLLLLAALAACDPPEPPRVPTTPSVAAAPASYLVWSRTDAKKGSTYETVLLGPDGAVLAKRPGVFVAGEALYEVKVVDERVPATGCSGGRVLEDQHFAHLEVVDVTNGKSVLTLAKREPMMEHEDGVAQREGERTVKVVGSIGTKLSLVEHEIAWECAWGRELAFAHAVDVATGTTDVWGICSKVSEAIAAKAFIEQAADRDVNLGELQCLGVTAELDPQHTWVAHHRLANAAGETKGIGMHLLQVDAEEPLPSGLDMTVPEIVKTFATTHPDVRGYAKVDSDAIRALFERM